MNYDDIEAKVVNKSGEKVVDKLLNKSQIEILKQFLYIVSVYPVRRK